MCMFHVSCACACGMCMWHVHVSCCMPYILWAYGSGQELLIFTPLPTTTACQTSRLPLLRWPPMADGYYARDRRNSGVKEGIGDVVLTCACETMCSTCYLIVDRVPNEGGMAYRRFVAFCCRRSSDDSSSGFDDASDCTTPVGFMQPLASLSYGRVSLCDGRCVAAVMKGGCLYYAHALLSVRPARWVQVNGAGVREHAVRHAARVGEDLFASRIVS